MATLNSDGLCLEILRPNQYQAGKNLFAAPVVNRDHINESLIPNVRPKHAPPGPVTGSGAIAEMDWFLLISDTKKCPSFYKSLLCKDLFCWFRYIQSERYAQ